MLQGRNLILNSNDVEHCLNVKNLIARITNQMSKYITLYTARRRDSSRIKESRQYYLQNHVAVQTPTIRGRTCVSRLITHNKKVENLCDEPVKTILKL